LFSEEMKMRQLKIGILSTVLLLGMAGVLRAADTMPSGTPIQVITKDSVSSKDAKVGQTIRGNVSQDVVVNGKTLIPRNAPVTLRVSTVQASGRLSTPAKLYLRLQSIEANGKTYDVSSSSTGHTAGSKKKRDIIAIGGGSALGAIIGGVVGGGKGAAIGAGAGAGAGTAGAAATGKNDITFGSETHLRFTLTQALTM
jgi:hypothetical protein